MLNIALSGKHLLLLLRWWWLRILLRLRFPSEMLIWIQVLLLLLWWLLLRLHLLSLSLNILLAVRRHALLRMLLLMNVGWVCGILLLLLLCANRRQSPGRHRSRNGSGRDTGRVGMSSSIGRHVVWCCLYIQWRRRLRRPGRGDVLTGAGCDGGLLRLRRERSTLQLDNGRLYFDRHYFGVFLADARLG